VVLNKHFKLAESLLLEQGETNRAIDMYRSLHKWDEAIEVAEAKNHPDLADLRSQYDNYLAHTHQEERAGQLKAREGDVQGALNLYLKAGLPARAAIVIMQVRSIIQCTPILSASVLLVCNAIHWTHIFSHSVLLVLHVAQACTFHVHHRLFLLLLPPLLCAEPAARK